MSDTDKAPDNSLRLASLQRISREYAVGMGWDLDAPITEPTTIGEVHDRLALMYYLQQHIRQVESAISASVTGREWDAIDVETIALRQSSSPTDE